jgi:predicted dehydrogenase
MPMSSTAGSDMLSVLIIGCGNIAGGFDADGNTVLTHAGAYLRHGGFRLAGCVDPDSGRRSAFQQRWGVEQAYAALPDALGSGVHYDVISICSPTPQHAADLRMVLRALPRLAFCEKPLAAEIKEARGLVTACRDAGVLLAVNYTRRWDPAVSAFKSALERGAWGAVRSAVGYYNKGVLNNGSHMMDLLLHLLGPLELQAIGAGPNAITLQKTQQSRRCSPRQMEFLSIWRPRQPAITRCLNCRS